MPLDLIKQIASPVCAWRYRRLLSPYADGELDHRASARVKVHLEKCAACRARYEDILFASLMVSNLLLPDQSPAVVPARLFEKQRSRGAGEQGSRGAGEQGSRRQEADVLSRITHHARILGLPRITYYATAAVLLMAAVVAVWYYTRPSAASWEVVRLAGTPTVASSPIARTGRLGVGEWLETDGSSRAMIEVGLIGQVEIDPYTRIRLVEADSTEHRLSLERGRMHATILAPPRMFFVETPSAVAIDMGCAYTLEVDDTGASTLHVTAGWVALSLDGRESLVPAGAICRTKPGRGPGTPYLKDASDPFRYALHSFDFEDGGSAALDVILKEARKPDSLTLWHLLSRTEGEARARVYDRLSTLAPPPDGVTREGVLSLDRRMLDSWREQIEYISVGVDPGNVPAATGSLKPAGTMNDARFSHTATLLSDGRVLVAGGRERRDVILASAELYDPATRRFTPTGSMTTRRVGHTATLLPDGKVLIAGGSSKEFYHGALASAELYDPATGRFTPTGNMTATRLAHEATLLPDGRVLITGGQSADWNKLASAEVYDPTTGVFIPTSSMKASRADHTATLLKDGRVLITGGSSGSYFSESIVASAEVYDPIKGSFAPTGSMAAARHKHSAEMLPDGRVIILGGADSRNLQTLYASAELYDTDTGAFAATGNMRTSRYKIRDAVVLLNDGKALIAGGGARVEVYDPTTGIFGAVAGGTGAPRYYSTATRLANGEVLIVGGYSNGLQPNASAWLYKPE
ncbi:MAG: zf-HC2 domain-containing protein [Blastocatellia bacterium]|nr:zf-HC2 domain-containing protein [Blastocatellia bacterium]